MARARICQACVHASTSRLEFLIATGRVEARAITTHDCLRDSVRSVVYTSFSNVGFRESRRCTFDVSAIYYRGIIYHSYERIMYTCPSIYANENRVNRYERKQNVEKRSWYKHIYRNTYLFHMGWQKIYIYMYLGKQNSMSLSLLQFEATFSF